MSETNQDIETTPENNEVAEPAAEKGENGDTAPKKKDAIENDGKLLLTVIKYDKKEGKAMSGGKLAPSPSQLAKSALRIIRAHLLNAGYIDKADGNKPFCTKDGIEVTDDITLDHYMEESPNALTSTSGQLGNAAGNTAGSGTAVEGAKPAESGNSAEAGKPQDTTANKNAKPVKHNIYILTTKRRTALDSTADAFLKKGVDLTNTGKVDFLTASTGNPLSSGFNSSSWAAEGSMGDIIHPVDMTEKEWGIVMRTNNLLCGQSLQTGPVDKVVKVQGHPDIKRPSMGIVGVKKSYYSAFALKPRTLPEYDITFKITEKGSEEMDKLGIPHPEHSFRIPRFQIKDASQVRVFETKGSLETTMAESSFSSKSIDAAAGGSAFGVSAAVKGGASWSNDDKSASSKFNDSSYMHVVYEFPRVELILNEETLELSDECKEDITNLRNRRTLKELTHFEERYGNFFARSIHLGGKLISIEESDSVAGSSVQEKSKMLKAAASASVSGYGFQAEVNYSQTENSGTKTTSTEKKMTHSMSWSADGGDTTLCNNPPKWCSTVSNFYNWRVMKQDDVVNLYEFIGKLPGYEDIPKLIYNIIHLNPKPTSLVQFSLHLETGTYNGPRVLTFGEDTEKEIAPLDMDPLNHNPLDLDPSRKTVSKKTPPNNNPLTSKPVKTNPQPQASGTGGSQRMIASDPVSELMDSVKISGQTSSQFGDHQISDIYTKSGENWFVPELHRSLRTLHDMAGHGIDIDNLAPEDLASHNIAPMDRDIYNKLSSEMVSQGVDISEMSFDEMVDHGVLPNSSFAQVIHPQDRLTLQQTLPQINTPEQKAQEKTPQDKKRPKRDIEDNVHSLRQHRKELISEIKFSKAKAGEYSTVFGIPISNDQTNICIEEKNSDGVSHPRFKYGVKYPIHYLVNATNGEEEDILLHSLQIGGDDSSYPFLYGKHDTASNIMVEFEPIYKTTKRKTTPITQNQKVKLRLSYLPTDTAVHRVSNFRMKDVDDMMMPKSVNLREVATKLPGRPEPPVRPEFVDLRLRNLEETQRSLIRDARHPGSMAAMYRARLGQVERVIQKHKESDTYVKARAEYDAKMQYYNRAKQIYDDRVRKYDLNMQGELKKAGEKAQKEHEKLMAEWEQHQKDKNELVVFDEFTFRVEYCDAKNGKNLTKAITAAETALKAEKAAKAAEAAEQAAAEAKDQAKAASDKAHDADVEQRKKLLFYFPLWFLGGYESWQSQKKKLERAACLLDNGKATRLRDDIKNKEKNMTMCAEWDLDEDINTARNKLVDNPFWTPAMVQVKVPESTT